MVPQQPKYPPWVRRPIQPISMSIDEQHHGPIRPISMSIDEQHHGPIQPILMSTDEQHHGQPHEVEEADMEGESDEVEQDEGQHHEIEQDEMVASQGHEVIHAYKARPIQRMLSGAASSGAESWHGPHPDKFRVTVDFEEAIADEFEQATAAENSDEFEHEEVESEMNSDDYEHYLAESVEPEHFQCFVGDKPVSVVVYDLSSVPNNQLVAELARRLGD